MVVSKTVALKLEFLDNDRVYSKSQASRLMNISRTSFDKYVDVEPISVDYNLKLYRGSDLNEWISNAKEPFL